MRTIDIEATCRAIRDRRQELGLTQSEAADRAGVTQGRWSQYETWSRSELYLATIIKIAGALECSHYDLVQTREGSDDQ